MVVNPVDNKTDSGSADPAGAVEWLLGVPGVVRSFGLGDAGRSELQSMLDAARIAQQALDGFVTRLGLVAVAGDGFSAAPREFLRGGSRSVRSGTVRRDAERVEAAGRLSAFADAVVDGRVGGDQLDSLARATKGLSDTQCEELNTPGLVAEAVDLPADQFDARVRLLAERAKADHGLSTAVRARRDSSFRHWFDPRSQMGKFSGQLDPERYEILHTAIDSAVASLARESTEATSKDDNLAAEALVSLVRGHGKHQSGRPEISIIVDEATARSGTNDGRERLSIRQTVNGHGLPPQTVDRHLCDAVLRRVVLDDRGVPINVGRRYRTATDAQWAAIKAVYSTCAWDGCDRPITWCQAHHIHEWEHGGATDLANLLPLCSRHHHQVHEGQWSIKLLDDRTLKTYRPDGTLWSTTPIPTRRPPPGRGSSP